MVRGAQKSNPQYNKASVSIGIRIHLNPNDKGRGFQSCDDGEFYLKIPPGLDVNNFIPLNRKTIRDHETGHVAQIGEKIKEKLTKLACPCNEIDDKTCTASFDKTIRGLIESGFADYRKMAAEQRKEAKEKMKREGMDTPIEIGARRASCVAAGKTPRF